MTDAKQNTAIPDKSLPARAAPATKHKPVAPSAGKYENDADPWLNFGLFGDHMKEQP